MRLGWIRPEGESRRCGIIEGGGLVWSSTALLLCVLLPGVCFVLHQVSRNCSAGKPPSRGPACLLHMGLRFFTTSCGSSLSESRRPAQMQPWEAALGFRPGILVMLVWTGSGCRGFQRVWLLGRTGRKFSRSLRKPAGEGSWSVASVGLFVWLRVETVSYL